jgi:hypothetical protein
MENKDHQESRLKVPVIILISIISLLAIYYAVMLMISPARKLEEIRQEFSAKSTEKDEVAQKILMDEDYLRLMKQKAFLQSRVVMAASDSIYLTINLSDSTANLEISGVIVHRTKMSKVKISSILSGANDNSVLTMLSVPLTISSSLATIKKEPVMVKIAPKDTSEYKPDIVPDTSLTEHVNYILEMDRGIRIYVYQEENDKFSDKADQLLFDLRVRLRDTWGALKSVAVFKVPDYHPYIRMKLPRTDAKIIYRAIPKNGQIAVFS